MRLLPLRGPPRVVPMRVGSSGVLALAPIMPPITPPIIPPIPPSEVGGRGAPRGEWASRLSALRFHVATLWPVEHRTASSDEAL